MLTDIFATALLLLVYENVPVLLFEVGGASSRVIVVPVYTKSDSRVKVQNVGIGKHSYTRTCPELEPFASLPVAPIASLFPSAEILTLVPLPSAVSSPSMSAPRRFHPMGPKFGRL